MLTYLYKKLSKDKNVRTYQKKTFNLVLRKYFSFLLYKLRFSKHDYSYNLINSDIGKNANFKKYDIINLHWVNSETISLQDVTKIKQKIVLTLHDMWAFCGSEHYLYDLPNKYFKKGKKKEFIFFRLFCLEKKRKLWKEKIFYIVTPSQWLSSLVKKSYLMRITLCQ